MYTRACVCARARACVEANSTVKGSSEGAIYENVHEA